MMGENVMVLWTFLDWISGDVSRGEIYDNGFGLDGFGWLDSGDAGDVLFVLNPRSNRLNMNWGRLSRIVIRFASSQVPTASFGVKTWDG